MAHILLIDDEKLVRETFRAILEGAGHTVDEAGDGNAALARFRERRPDLVITDIFMPDQEGIGTILEIRKIDERVPIIVVTGGAHAELNMTSATRLGATRALLKPVRSALLLSAIDECLRAAG
jgi:CheY-like chemotaxis protein